MLSIRPADIQEDAGGWLLNLPATNPVVPSGRNKTGGRPVPLGSSGARLLSYISQVGIAPDERVFKYSHNSLSTLFCRLKKQFLTFFGRPFPGRLYDFRHTRLTQYYSAGIPDQVVRRVAGWTPSSKMPNVYCHIGSTHVLSVFEQVYGAVDAGRDRSYGAIEAIPEHEQTRSELLLIRR